MKNFIEAFKKNSKVIILIGVIFIILLIPLSIIELKSSNPNTVLTITKNILITIESSLVISIVWEFVGKTIFTKQVMDTFQITKDLSDTKIKRVYSDFNDIDWKSILSKCKNFKCFMSYGYSWRNTNSKSLIKAIAQCDSFVIVFPNYNDSNIISGLNSRYGYDGKSKNVVNFIKESAEWFKDNGATVKLYNGTLCSSFYLIDDYCEYCLPKHGVQKVNVPVIEVESESPIYPFIAKDFERIEKNSQEYAEVAKND